MAEFFPGFEFFFFTPLGTRFAASYLYRAYHYTIRSSFDVMCLELSELQLSHHRKQPEKF